MSQSSPQEPQWFKPLRPFVFGGMAGMTATCFVQPIDMVKVRIQLVGDAMGKGGAGPSKNPFVIARGIIAEGGVSSLYKGLSAALLRQATYTTTRMGLFRTFVNKLKDEHGEITVAKRAQASLAAGAIGAFVGNPADVALVRMQADKTLPEAERRNYKNVADALIKMTRQEGPSAWMAGVAPTMVRAMALNLGMLTTYDTVKKHLHQSYGDTATTRLGSSAIAGFFAAFLCCPFDFVKTRMQKQTKLADGTMPYKNMVDCAAKVIRYEGPFAFYNGFATVYVRLAPHAMITLLAADVFNSMYFKSIGVKENLNA
jgi:solute carrier family 25 oxoglutarate transporter 11